MGVTSGKKPPGTHPPNSPQAPLLLRPCCDAGFVGESYSSGTRAESFYKRHAGLRPVLKADSTLIRLRAVQVTSSPAHYCQSFGVTGGRKISMLHTGIGFECRHCFSSYSYALTAAAAPNLGTRLGSLNQELLLVEQCENCRTVTCTQVFRRE